MTGCPDAARACVEALDALHAYLDGELEPERVGRTERHLDACRRCGLEADTYRELKAVLRGTGNCVDPATLSRLKEFAARLALEHHA